MVTNPGSITTQLIDDRAVVVTAPTHSTITIELLAELALGRGLDSYVGDNLLTLGVPGLGEGIVTYRVGAYDPHRRVYPLDREVTP